MWSRTLALLFVPLDAAELLELLRLMQGFRVFVDIRDKEALFGFFNEANALVCQMVNEACESAPMRCIHMNVLFVWHISDVELAV